MIKIYLMAAEWLYHPFAWAYDAVAWLVSFGYWSQWRKDTLNYLKTGKILEIGFGTGSLLIEMTRRGLDVTGIEPSKQMQRVTARKLARVGLDINRVQGLVQHLPFRGGEFTNIISTFPTIYISDPVSLDEVRRVIEADGRWLILGLGLRFKSRFKRWVTGWLLGDWENAWIKAFINSAQMAGFTSQTIFHETAAYELPILVLEVVGGKSP